MNVHELDLHPFAPNSEVDSGLSFVAIIQV